MPLLTENIKSLQERITAPLLGVVDCLPPELQKCGNIPYSLSALEFAKKSLKLP
jgi:dethiobiotin synthetase